MRWISFLQCFEFDEVKRIREELDWKGRMIFLMGPFKKGEESKKETLALAQVASVADGIGPLISEDLVQLTAQAHAAGLLVHPYTLRVDALPKWSASADALMRFLFREAKVDGLFSDFPDVVVKWLGSKETR